MGTSMGPRSLSPQSKAVKPKTANNSILCSSGRDSNLNMSIFLSEADEPVYNSQVLQTITSKKRKPPTPFSMYRATNVPKAKTPLSYQTVDTQGLFSKIQSGEGIMNSLYVNEDDFLRRQDLVVLRQRNVDWKLQNRYKKYCNVSQTR